jgi:hypothetical protein
MKKIFLFLLKIYTKTEIERIEVYKKLHNNNIYNSYTEFLMAQDIIKEIAVKDDFVSSEIVKSGLEKSYYEALDNLKKEK